MEKANERRMSKEPLNNDPFSEDWYKLLWKVPPIVKEIFAKAEQISDPAEMEAFLETELENCNFWDIADAAYKNMQADCTVFLLPGSASFRLQSPGFFKLAKKLVPLENYVGTIFVFRSKDREQVAELRVGRNEKIAYSIWVGNFVDPDWPDDETEVKVLSMKDYEILLRRMLSKKS